MAVQGCIALLQGCIGAMRGGKTVLQGCLTLLQGCIGVMRGGIIVLRGRNNACVLAKSGINCSQIPDLPRTHPENLRFYFDPHFQRKE